jgi:hypothetical protein
MTSAEIKLTKTVEALMAENSRLKKEIQLATEKIVPPSYIPQDIAAECLFMLNEVGMGKSDKKNGLYSMLSELCERYKELTIDVNEYRDKYKALVRRFDQTERAIFGEDVDLSSNSPFGAANLIVKKIMRFRAVLEAISIRVERLSKTHPDLINLHNDITAFLDKKAGDSDDE